MQMKPNKYQIHWNNGKPPKPIIGMHIVKQLNNNNALNNVNISLFIIVLVSGLGSIQAAMHAYSPNIKMIGTSIIVFISASMVCLTLYAKHVSSKRDENRKTIKAQLFNIVDLDELPTDRLQAYYLHQSVELEKANKTCKELKQMVEDNPTEENMRNYNHAVDNKYALGQKIANQKELIADLHDYKDDN